MARKIRDPEGSEDTPILSKLSQCPVEWRAWVLARFRALNATRPLGQRARVCRLVGLVVAVRMGRVGSYAWGRSMLGKLGRSRSRGRRGGR